MCLAKQSIGIHSCNSSANPHNLFANVANLLVSQVALTMFYITYEFIHENGTPMMGIDAVLPSGTQVATVVLLEQGTEVAIEAPITPLFFNGNFGPSGPFSSQGIELARARRVAATEAHSHLNINLRRRCISVHSTIVVDQPNGFTMLRVILHLANTGPRIVHENNGNDGNDNANNGAINRANNRPFGANTNDDFF